MTDLDDRFEFAVRIAREAGKQTLKLFQSPELAVESKSDRTPVTAADRDAERFLRDQIRERFADDAIVGEEFDDRPGTSPYRWILDPIDGTKSFVHGVPLYGTLIGVEASGIATIGVIEIPGLGERVYACRGKGAWYGRGEEPPRVARTSTCDTLDDALLLTTSIRSFSARGALEALLELTEKARLTRTWGDCYGYLLVATGRADVMIDPAVNVWDAAALQPILEEAGGAFTDWQGEPTIYGGDAIGTTPALLETVLAVTRRFPPR